MPAQLFRQLGGGLLRDLLRDYVDWFLARPKLRERIPRSPSAKKAALF